MKSTYSFKAFFRTYICSNLGMWNKICPYSWCCKNTRFVLKNKILQDIRNKKIYLLQHRQAGDMSSGYVIKAYFLRILTRWQAGSVTLIVNCIISDLTSKASLQGAWRRTQILGASVHAFRVIVRNNAVGRTLSHAVLNCLRLDYVLNFPQWCYDD